MGEGKVYSGKDVAVHNSRESCWIIVHGECWLMVCFGLLCSVCYEGQAMRGVPITMSVLEDS